LKKNDQKFSKFDSEKFKKWQDDMHELGSRVAKNGVLNLN